MIGAYFILQQAANVGESLPMRYTLGVRKQGSGDLGSANAVGESTKLRAVVMTENESTSPLE